MCSRYYEDGSDLNESFVSIVQLAREDEEIALIISKIITLSRSERCHFLDRLVWSLQQQGAPQEFIEAMGYLYDDSIVESLKEYMKG